MASSSTFSSSTVLNSGSQQYIPYPSHVNAASFLSIQLSGETNYGRWQKQMMCLVDSHDMLGFIDGTLKCPQENDDSENKAITTAMDAKCREWKRSDTLVQGWIFGSLSKDVMCTVVDLHTAHDVWKKLNTTYSSPAAPTSDKDTVEYIPLCRAILRGDLEKAYELFNQDKDALTAVINDLNERALHVAISTCKNIQLVENILKEINPDSLPNLVDHRQYNPLHCAAIYGNTMASKAVVEKNPRLLFMFDNEKCLPIHRAIMNSHKSTFKYLLAVSKHHIELSQQDGYQSPFDGESGVRLITNVIDAGLLGFASELIQEFPTMARTTHEDKNALKSIANKPDAYFSGTEYNFYQRFVYSHVPLLEKNNLDDENQRAYNTMSRRSCFHPAMESIYVKFWEVAVLVPHIKQILEVKVKHNEALMLLKCICKEVGKLNTSSDIFKNYGNAFIRAVKNDTPEAVEEMVGCFPRAIWTMSNNYFISQIAIINRCEKVYNSVLHQVTNKHLHRTCVDKNGNNVLHLAAQLAPIHKLNLVSGAALQMQRELHWFLEVEKFVLPSYNEQENVERETPIMLFRKTHKELRKDGEVWMKKTADSYTITAALIITIAFAAAITVPGGNNGDTGKAIYATNTAFIIFAVSDAISLFTSTTSLLLFLSILTARYRDEDFVYRLPKRLILGLIMLFLSVTSMMVAFSATLYLLFGPEKTWILIPIAALTCLPIASFVTLQFPLLVDLISSTYGHGIFTKHTTI